MKKNFLLIFIVLIFLMTFTNMVHASTIPSNTEEIISPMYVIYCTGNTPDGKHHLYNNAAKVQIKLKNSDGSFYKNYDAQPAGCRYCNMQVNYDYTTHSTYIDASKVYRSSWDIFGFTDWAYRIYVKSINPSAIEIHSF